MKRKAALIGSKGEQKPDGAFLREYQRCVLLSLKEEGILSQKELESAIVLLEKQQQ